MGDLPFPERIEHGHLDPVKLARIEPTQPPEFYTGRPPGASLARLPGETLGAFYERQEHVNAGLDDV